MEYIRLISNETMKQSVWTTASMLASGAAIGALITFVVMNEPKKKAKKSEISDSPEVRDKQQSPPSRTDNWRSNSFISIPSDGGDGNIPPTGVDQHPDHHDRPSHTMNCDHDENWHLPQHTSPNHQHQHSHRLQEAMEKRDRLPSLIILVRHGESEGNADHTLYRTKPDNLVELTQKGIKQAREAGKRVENIFVSYDQEQLKGHHPHPNRLTWKSENCSSSISSLGDDEIANENDDEKDPANTSVTPPSMTSSTSSVQPSIKRAHLIISPFERTLQTAAAMRKGFEHRIVRTDVQPRIREQEFGNLQGDDFQLFREEQKRVGRFWYRFPTGESGSDVSDRVQSWWFDSVLNVNERFGYAPIDALVVVTHGLTMRFVLMQLYGWSPTTFHSVWNADNCDVYVLKKDLTKPGLSPYVLDDTYGGNMPKSSIDLLVEFHNDTTQVDAEMTNEDTQSRQRTNQKQFKLTDYLSIPPPRTTQLELVKKKLVEQYPEEIDNVDSIKSIVFMPFFDGALTQGRSTSGKPPHQKDYVGEKGLADEAAIKPTDGVKIVDKSHSPKRGKIRSSNRFPYYPEVQDDSWRPKQKRDRVIAERDYR
ncbi:unnamed protein product [Cylindrotheca closterium]|uniref:Uncharacterized protein n=1 Tax=Cylindrotheca closterium TaxID=2856 RepID=A0AAD2CR64_9STRA|nr:unnamed protein product [Cylindrotheca closterium]